MLNDFILNSQNYLNDFIISFYNFHENFIPYITLRNRIPEVYYWKNINQLLVLSMIFFLELSWLIMKISVDADLKMMIWQNDMLTSIKDTWLPCFYALSCWCNTNFYSLNKLYIRHDQYWQTAYQKFLVA